MKTGFNKKLIIAVALLSISAPAFAVATLVAAAVATAVYAVGATVVVTAIAFVATAVVTKSFIKSLQPGANGAGDAPNPGNRQQLPPATDNKLPVVYGKAWVGGTVIDLSISEDNQQIYYVIALCEVTDNGNDTITFGDIYWGGKKCVFGSSNQVVTALVDESTGESDSSIDGKLEIFLYRNGSFTPTNSSQSANAVMQTSGLIYTWDETKLMTNTAFAIVHLSYNTDAGTTGLQQTKFEVTNSRYAPGDCLLDYMTNEVYGAAIPVDQIDTTTLTALNTYSAGSFSYVDANGDPATQTRFRFDGVIDTQQNIMANIQDMASCCDCLVRYNEIEGKWGVVVQSPTYDIAMALDDSNIVSAIQITPTDLAGSYNVAEVKFPDETNQDSFNTATLDLQAVAPQLLFPNEPTNKQSIALPLVNNNVRAQYLANRFLKGARDDLQVSCTINYEGIQLEAGDIVTVTSANYGWVAKEFRVIKVTENFDSDGSVTAKLMLSEFNASVYDDVSITQFQPAPNTGIPDPLVFGAIPAPVVGAEYPTQTNPLFLVTITAPPQGIIQYAELWYSAFSSPTASQLIFAGTTEIQPGGNPYDPGSTLPAISLADIPAGTWYFFARMVNSLGTSGFSPASTAFVWRPTTFQYTEKYLAVAYADNADGTSNFSLSPTGRSYFGLLNTSASSGSHTADEYTWYLADPTFGTTVFLCYANRTGRKFSFDTGFAAYAAGTGAFVPTQALVFDPRIWSALPDGVNYIDLDQATGQVLQTGTTTVGTGEIAVTNSADGKVIASLKQYLDFGSGIYQKTASAATLTIDIYGRVVGFEEPDSFYMTIEVFTATSGQTVFSVTRASDYISGQCLVFVNGTLAETSEYSDTGGSTGTVTFGTGQTAGNIVTIMSFRSVNSTTGTYASFSRNTATLTNASSYTPSGFTITSGYELLFMNGVVWNENDYDIVGGDVTNFPSVATGLLTVIEWSQNNLTTPNGDPVNVFINAVIGQTAYSFSYTTDAFNLYGNGVLLVDGSDYTSVSGGYTLANTPTTTAYGLLQQTFARTGAA